MSTLQFDKWKDKGGVREFAPCTAWVSFDGSGTVSIKDNMNVSSVIDYGVGYYGVNFTVPLINTNYAVLSTAGAGSQTNPIHASESDHLRSVSECRVYVNRGDGNALLDGSNISVAVFGGV